MRSMSSKRAHLTAFTSERDDIVPRQAATAAVHEQGNVRESGQRWTEPINVHDGVFEGKVVRFLMQCVQEPISGKRKMEKDRRPLAPVPIVRLWVRECHRDAAGVWIEEGLDLSDLDPSCLICEVEISPDVEGEIEDIPVSMLAQGPVDSRVTPLYDASFDFQYGRFPSGSRSGTPTPQPHVVMSPHDTMPAHEFVVLEPGSVLAGMTLSVPTRSTIGPGLPSAGPSVAPTSSFAPYPASEPQHLMASDVSGRIRAPRSRKIQRTETQGETSLGISAERNLFGALHVAAVKVIAPTEELGLWFLFTDLCVKVEGIYSLRFRVFDLSVINPGMPPVPSFVECESQLFKVYAPRAYPGLPKPSALSEHFIKQGFKLNTRKNERTAKSPSPDSAPISPHPNNDGSSGLASRLDMARTPAGSKVPTAMWPER